MKKDKEKKDKDQDEQQSTGTKKVAFFVQSLTDTVKSIDGNNYNIPVEDMESPFWIEADEAGNDDLCTEISDSITSIDGVFKDGNGVEYELTSQDFVGGRPPTR